MIYGVSGREECINVSRFVFIRVFVFFLDIIIRETTLCLQN